MQENYPQKPGIDFILKQAFFYWNKTLVYQLMFSIVYFALMMPVIFYLSEKYQIINQLLGAVTTYLKAGPKGIAQYQTDIATIQQSAEFSYFQLGIFAVSVFLYPLNLGLFQIFRKVDLKESLEISDLFAGYNGLNFFKYAFYYFFWMLVLSVISFTLVLPFVWVLVTLFVAPLKFFLNKTTFEAIAINFKALRVFFIEILVCALVAFIFKYLGFAVLLIGGLFTLPFWNAMIYSLYKTIFNEKS